MTTPSIEERLAMGAELAEGPLAELQVQFREACQMVPGDHVSPFIGLALVNRLAAAERRAEKYMVETHLLTQERDAAEQREAELRRLVDVDLAAHREWMAKIAEAVGEPTNYPEAVRKVAELRAEIERLREWANKTEHRGFASDYDRGFVLAQQEVLRILALSDSPSEGTDE